MLQKCPYSGELFVPQRRNQVYATPKNRRDFHNQIAAELRSLKRPLDRLLERNFILLSELIKKGEEKSFTKEFLSTEGFNNAVFTHLKNYKGRTCKCLYHFVFIPTENNELIKIVNKQDND